MRAYFGSLAALAVSAIAAGASPAELPASGYLGRAFVDSEGCAFTRAQLNDAIVWVTRLDAARVPVCDEVPTFAGNSERVFVTSPVAVRSQQTPTSGVSKRAVSPANFKPTGFKRAWTDGRFNPNRGPRTSAGDAAMARKWSDDVPMVRR